MFNTHRRFIVLLLTLLLSSALGSFLATAAASPLAQESQNVRVATKALEPFVIKNPDGTYRGFSIDLWEEIARRLSLKYEWIDVETVANQIQSVQDNSADVAIAGISMTPKREELVDFSHPIFRSGLQIMVPAKSDVPQFEQVILAYLPIVLRIVVIGAVIAFIMANIIWFIERRQNPEFQQGYWRGLWEGMWWFFGVVATGEYQGQPTQGLRRAITIIWWLLGVLLLAQFTATMTTTLTMQQLGGQISGPSDLAGKRIATVQGTTAADYLSQRFIRFTGVQEIEDAYALLEEDEVDAVVFDAPVLTYYANTHGKGSVSLVGPLFNEDYYGIALPRNSPLRKPINEALLQIREDGTYEALVDEWFQSAE